MAKQGTASDFIRKQMALGKSTSQIKALALTQGIKFSANLPYVVRYQDKVKGKPHRIGRPKRKLTEPSLTPKERAFLKMYFLEIGPNRAGTLLESFKAKIERDLR